MQFELESILMDSFPPTAKNLQNAFFTQCSWDLKIGGVYDSHPLSLTIYVHGILIIQVGF